MESDAQVLYDASKLSVLYDAVIGSRAYNLVTPTSDYDHRRVVTSLDYSHFFGLKTFKAGNVITTQDDDNTDYSLKDFTKKILECNTIMMEVLFAPDDCINYANPLFKKYFVDNKHFFISKKLYKQIIGFSKAEYERSLGIKKRKLGGERKEDIAIMGYSPRNATHCIRLLWSGATALLTGDYPIRWEGHERDLLYKIKLKTLTLEEYNQLRNEALKNIDAALEKSTLKDDVDFEYVDGLLVNFYTEFFNIRKDTI